MQQLTGLDASMLYMETAQTPNHVAALYTYDPATAPGGSVPFEAIVDNVGSRLGLSRTFRRKLVRVPLGLDHPYWVEDEDFDLEFHIRQAALPRPGTWTQLWGLVADLYARPLDLSRPPWEMHVIEGLDDDVDGIPSGGFAVLTKIHHAAVDGVSGMELMTVLHDRTAQHDAADAPDVWRPESPPTTFDLLGRATIHNLVKPMHAVRVAGRLAPTLVSVPVRIRQGALKAPPVAIPNTRFNAPVGPHRSIDAIRTDLDNVKNARSCVPGSTVNDVVLTIVGGALRRYLESKDELPSESMVALVPMSTRSISEAGTGGNQIVMMTATLASDQADPVQRLALVSAGMRDVKDLADALGGKSLSDLSNAMPGLLLGLGSRGQAQLAARNVGRAMANTTVTNVPGPNEPLYFTGARVVGPYGAGPFAHGMGLIHLVGSYVGQMAFSFTADRAMMPDPAFYAVCLRESLDEMLAAAAASVPRAASKRPRRPATRR